jgi:hypothetical protein
MSKNYRTRKKSQTSMSFPWFLVAIFVAIVLSPLVLRAVLQTLGVKNKTPQPTAVSLQANKKTYRDPVQLTLTWWGPTYVATVDQYGREEQARLPVKVQLWQQVEFLHKQGNPSYSIPQGSTGPWLRYITTRMTPNGTAEVYEVEYANADFSVYLQCQQLGPQQVSFDSH